MIVDKIKKREPTAKQIDNKVDIQVSKWVKCDICKEQTVEFAQTVAHILECILIKELNQL